MNTITTYTRKTDNAVFTFERVEGDKTIVRNKNNKEQSFLTSTIENTEKYIKAEVEKTEVEKTEVEKTEVEKTEKTEKAPRVKVDLTEKVNSTIKLAEKIGFTVSSKKGKLTSLRVKVAGAAQVPLHVTRNDYSAFENAGGSVRVANDKIEEYLKDLYKRLTVKATSKKQEKVEKTEK